MATPGTTATIVAEYDGQVGSGDALTIAREAVIKLDDVYRVEVRTEDGDAAFATADFDPDLSKPQTKVVTDSGRL